MSASETYRIRRIQCVRAWVWRGATLSAFGGRWSITSELCHPCAETADSKKKLKCDLRLQEENVWNNWWTNGLSHLGKAWVTVYGQSCNRHTVLLWPKFLGEPIFNGPYAKFSAILDYRVRHLESSFAGFRDYLIAKHLYMHIKTNPSEVCSVKLRELGRFLVRFAAALFRFASSLQCGC